MDLTAEKTLDVKSYLRKGGNRRKEYQEIIINIGVIMMVEVLVVGGGLVFGFAVPFLSELLPS